MELSTAHSVLQGASIPSTRLSEEPWWVTSTVSMSSLSKVFEDEEAMSGVASDTSTVFDDEPRMVGLSCYDFLPDSEPSDSEPSFDDHAVWGNALEPSDEETTPLAQYLVDQNKRLEEENAFLRNCYQMAQTGYAPQAQEQAAQWLQAQAQWHLSNQAAGCLTPMCIIPPVLGSGPPGLARHGPRNRRIKIAHDSGAEGDAGSSSQTGSADASLAVPHTSVMLRNLPNSYTRKMLMDLLDQEGFAGLYDFVYLPMDFKTHVSLAYVFINFVNADVVRRFWKSFHGFSNWALPSHKVARVNWDECQGLAAHIQRYRDSPVMHEDVPDEFKPVLLKDAHRIPFPVPLQKIRAPRCRLRTKGMQPGRLV